MSMRGNARRAIAVDVAAFGWDRAIVPLLRHSTLPWGETLGAAPLTKDLGARDSLSLAGQFAAHIAFLQFAGIGDAAFDPNEWAVVRKRGNDCRLVRIAARDHDSQPPLPLTLIHQFAGAVQPPQLDVLRQSWARAETVYHEAESRLRHDAAADLRWVHASATGGVDSRTFLLSPLLGAMPADVNREWAERFVQSLDFARYLDDGEVPGKPVVLQEPLRSFIAAVALLGTRVPKALVDRFL